MAADEKLAVEERWIADLRRAATPNPQIAALEAALTKGSPMNTSDPVAVRFRCLELANTHDRDFPKIVEAARMFERFVFGQDEPAAPSASTPHP